jgi:membrane dipeptidase
MKISLDDVTPHPLQKGFHRPTTIPQIFVDSCVQIWPDTDFTTLHTHAPTAYCITTFRPHDGGENALDEIANWHRIARTYPGIRIAYQAADIVAAKEAGQAAIVLNSQGGDFLGPNLHRLELFHRMGLRMMIPAYNSRSNLCDGCLEPDGVGLSTMGRAWVAECNRLGVLIDLTHVAERATLEILDRTEQPVVFSHSNPKRMVDNVRNITDEQIDRCAATGGVVAPTNWGPLNFREGMSERPTLSHYLDAIDYLVDRIGIEHVGIGTDMSHGTYPDGDLIRGLASKSVVASPYARHVEHAPRSKRRYVEGFDDYGDLPGVAEALAGRGYSDAQIGLIFGGNWLRVFRSVWGG